MIEHVDLYDEQDTRPGGRPRLLIPLGKAGDPPRGRRRDGHQLPVDGASTALEAVEQTGIDAELIDLRWLDRASLDWDTIGASIRKTNACSSSSRARRAPPTADGSPTRSSAASSTGSTSRSSASRAARPVPSISKVLERAAIARTEEVVAGLERVRAGRGGR